MVFVSVPIAGALTIFQVQRSAMFLLFENVNDPWDLWCCSKTRREHLDGHHHHHCDYCTVEMAMMILLLFLFLLMLNRHLLEVEDASEHSRKGNQYPAAEIVLSVSWSDFEIREHFGPIRAKILPSVRD